MGRSYEVLDWMEEAGKSEILVRAGDFGRFLLVICYPPNGCFKPEPVLLDVTDQLTAQQSEKI